MQHCGTFWKICKQNLILTEVKHIFMRKLNALICKSFIENMKPKVPTMSCSSKTAPALLCTHLEGWYILFVVYSDTGSWKHTVCCHINRMYSVMAGHLSVRMMNIS